MYKKFPQQNYIYTGEKPEMSRGDSSIESESVNEKEDEKENDYENLNDIKLTENYLEIPKDKEIPPIHIPFKDKELFLQNKQGFFFCSTTKDTENGCPRPNSNNKEDNLSIKNKFLFNKENNRYSNFNYILKNNCRFLSSFQDDIESEDEDIVNNEISINFTEDFMNNKVKSNKNNQIEIPLNDNFSKLNSNSEISNSKIRDNNIIKNNINNSYLKNINKDKINEIKKENFMKKNEINENIENIILNIDKSKKEWIKKSETKMTKNMTERNKDNKENFNSNGRYDKEIYINLNELKNINKIIPIKKNQINNNISNDINKNLNGTFFEIKNTQNSKNNSLSKSKKCRNIPLKKKRYINILNLTKKYNIFHKFLCISIDTSGLYTLDNEMNSLLLNPKISYNYPYNNLEKDLE